VTPILLAALMAGTGLASPDASLAGPVLADSGAPADAGTPADAGPVGSPPPEVRPPPPPVPTVTLRGRVVARGSREPLGGVSISIDTVAAGETDADGRFEVRCLPGRRAVQVQSPGYAPLQVTLDARAGATAEILFRLDPRLTGDRYETVVTPPDERASKITLRDEELRQVPGSFGDPFRVIESLPGVAQVAWPLSVYAIRGANPGNTGFFVDGVKVPALFHFALGPSVIHPFFLQQIDFYPGGYPARFGGFTSGVVSATTANPPTDRVHASVDVRLFDAGGIVTTPFDGGRGSVAVAGRMSYTGLLFGLLSPNLVFTYWDYQLRVEHTLGPGKLTLFAFGSGDYLKGTGNAALFGQGPNDVPDQPYIADLSFHRAELRWEGTLLGGRLLLSGLAGRDSSFTNIREVVSFPAKVVTNTAASRLQYTHGLAWWSDLELGGDGNFQRFLPEVDLPPTIDRTDLFTRRNVIQGGAYLGLTLRTRERLTVAPALRVEYFREQGISKAEPSPRLTVRLNPFGKVWLKAMGGRYAQLASLPVEVPGFESFGLRDFGPQTSWQGSFGVETPVGSAISLEMTGFYQRVYLTDLKSIFMDNLLKTLVQGRQGQSYGVEVLLRRALTKRLYGWLAYTLSKSERLIGYYRQRVDSDWDQRHILNLVTAYRFDHGWSAGTRVHYNTGRPYPVSDSRSLRVDYLRLPPFFQLDLRVDKRFVLDRYVLSAYVELVNTTLSREVFDLKMIEGQLQEKSFRIVLPSIGIHADF
jgi:hypothetical protein